MLSVIEKEQNIEIKNAMIAFVCQIHRDMIDFGYPTILGITSVILTALEENRIEWTDPDDINAMRKQYILNWVSANSQRSSANQAEAIHFSNTVFLL